MSSVSFWVDNVFCSVNIILMLLWLLVIIWVWPGNLDKKKCILATVWNEIRSNAQKINIAIAPAVLWITRSELECNSCSNVQVVLYGSHQFVNGAFGSFQKGTDVIVGGVYLDGESPRVVEFVEDDGAAASVLLRWSLDHLVALQLQVVSVRRVVPFTSLKYQKKINVKFVFEQEDNLQRPKMSTGYVLVCYQCPTLLLQAHFCSNHTTWYDAPSRPRLCPSDTRQMYRLVNAFRCLHHACVVSFFWRLSSLVHVCAGCIALERFPLGWSVRCQVPSGKYSSFTRLLGFHHSVNKVSCLTKLLPFPPVCSSLTHEGFSDLRFSSV